MISKRRRLFLGAFVVALSLFLLGALLHTTTATAASADNLSPASNRLDSSGGSPVITLTITKVVVGATPVGDWEFTGASTIGNFTIPAAGGAAEFTVGALGIYSITEVIKPGFYLTVDCGMAQWQTLGNGVIVFANYVDIACIFTNTQLANVTIVKKAVPKSNAEFKFFTSQKVSFSLIDDGSGISNTIELKKVIPGSFYIEEIERPGWSTASRCDIEHNGTSVHGDNVIGLTLAPGAHALCTFTNTMNTITVIKEATPESDQVFDFHWIGFPGDSAVSSAGAAPLPEGVFQLVDDGSGVGQSYVITEVVAGFDYIVSEESAPGWKLDSLSCIDNTGAAAGNAFPEFSYVELSIEAGQQYTCTFHNVGPSIALTKTVGLDPATCAASSQVEVMSGTEVYYCFTVKNTSHLTFTTHTLEDSVLGVVAAGLEYDLAPGASVFITQAHTATSSVTNVATWTAAVSVTMSGLVSAGVAPSTTVVSATATSSATVTVTSREPKIELQKTVGVAPGVCASGDQTSVFSGTKVYYCFTVKNTGNVTLTKHSLQDSVLGQVLANFDYALAPGASVSITRAHTATVGVTNVATWTASYQAGQEMGSAVASDSATVIVTPREPGIELRKTVGVQAGACSQYSDIIVPTGTTVYYCYTVKNTGNITLPLHTLVDDKLGNLLVGFPYNLGPGQSVSSVQAGAVISAVITANTTNVATWTAGVPGGGSVSATATARVQVGVASISVIKTVSKNATGCGAATTINVQAGEQVYFCVTVQNTGSFTLTHHIIDDPLLNFKMAIPYVLKPGEVVVITRDIAPQLGPVTVDAPITNTVTFTSSTHAPSQGAVEAAAAQPIVAVASATAVAVVKIETPTAMEETPEPSADLSRRLYLPLVNR